MKSRSSAAPSLKTLAGSSSGRSAVPSPPPPARREIADSWLRPLQRSRSYCEKLNLSMQSIRVPSPLSVALIASFSTHVIWLELSSIWGRDLLITEGDAVDTPLADKLPLLAAVYWSESDDSDERMVHLPVEGHRGLRWKSCLW